MANFLVEPGQGGDLNLTDALGRRILLHTKPEPSGKKADLILRRPVDRAVASSPITLAFALRLNDTVRILDRFVGIVNAQEAHLVLPDLVGRFRSGQIQNAESLQVLRGMRYDVIFTFAYPHDNPSLAGALHHYNLPYATIDAWYESSLLDRIRWMEFIGYFFGVEDEARRTISEIYEDVDRTTSEMRSDGRKVLWFTDFQGYQFVTGGNSWVAHEISRLGSRVVTQDSGARGSVETSREWIGNKMVEADVIVFTMVRPSMQHISSLYPEIVGSPAYRNNRVFGFGVGYWQEGAYAPERWFRELATILQPSKGDLRGLRIFAQVAGQ